MKDAYSEYDKEVFHQANRIRKALEEAILTVDGNEFSNARLVGLINGTQQFLAGVVADLFEFTEDQYIQLQIDAVTVFSKACGCDSLRVVDENNPERN